MSPEFDLTGKRAVVSGISYGIGQEIAKALAETGARWPAATTVIGRQTKSMGRPVMPERTDRPAVTTGKSSRAEEGY